MINFKELRKMYDKLSIYDIQNASKISYKSLNEYKQVAKELQDSSFCPKSFMQFILQCTTVTEISQKDITFHLFHQGNIDGCIYKIFRTIKQCIIIKNYFNIEKHMHIYIIFNPAKKYIPDIGHITCEHINGGFTMTSSNSIFIIREEEYSKVIIHELLHHCQMLHKDSWPYHELTKLKSVFNIATETNLVPNECIIEFWATILYCMFLSFEYGVPFAQLINTEIQHNIEQCNKIKYKQQNASTTTWYETTNSYCYIVFKCILLFNMQKFLQNNTWPYSTEYVTNFLIAHYNSVPLTKKQKNKSLRMMKLSDY